MKFVIIAKRRECHLKKEHKRELISLTLRDKERNKG